MIRDKNVDSSSTSYHADMVVKLCNDSALTNGVANTTVQDAWIAPFAGKVVAASTYCTSVAATGTVDLFKASTTMLSAPSAPVALTATDITALVTTVTFALGDTISLRAVTTGGSGAITKPTINLLVRPLVGKEVFGY